MKSIPKLCVYFTIATLLPSIFSFDPDVQKAIDQVVGDFIELNRIPGLGVAIVKSNATGISDFLTKGYGFKDLENQIEVDNRTLFAIGSITKSFTATVIVKTLNEKFPHLEEDALDIPIRALLPSMNFMLSDRFRSESTTFRDLLSHRSCLNPGAFGMALRPYKSKEEFIYRQRYAEEMCPFRTTFLYSNLAYALAGEIIAQISNSTFEAMLTDLLREIGMNDTILVKDEDDYDTLPNMSRCYYSDNGEIKRYNSSLLKWISIAAAPGGILSTAEDMLKYLAFHLNNGKVGEKQIVKEDVIKYLRKSSMHIPLPPPSKSNPDDVTVGFTAYGLGFLVGLLDGWESISHDGSLPPYSSYLSFYPNLNLGIYSVANGPTLFSSVKLHQLIYEIIEKGKRSFDKPVSPILPSNHPVTNDTSIKKCVDKSAFDTENIEGIYGNALEGEFLISEINSTDDDVTFYLKYGIWGTGNLRHLSNTSFAIEWETDIVQLMTFVGVKSLTMDFGEKNQASIVLPTGQKIVYHKNLTLDKLPFQPWDNDSCGPTEL